MNELPQPGPYREIELVKVQIFSEHLHVEYWTFLAIVYPLLIVVVIALLPPTGLSQSNPLLVTVAGGIAAVILLAVVVKRAVDVVGGKYHRDLRRVSDYLEDIQKGKSLPPLKDIMKLGKGR